MFLPTSLPAAAAASTIGNSPSSSFLLFTSPNHHQQIAATQQAAIMTQGAGINMEFYDPKKSTTLSRSSMAAFPNLFTLGSEDLCIVCGDKAIGKHYGAISCNGCKGFFRRTVWQNLHYTCRFSNVCNVDKEGRNACRACRFRKCLAEGMRPEAIQNERDRIGSTRRLNKKQHQIGAYDATLQMPIIPQQMPISRTQFATHQFDSIGFPIINPFEGGNNATLLSAISPSNLNSVPAAVDFRSRSSTSCSVLTNESSTIASNSLVSGSGQIGGTNSSSLAEIGTESVKNSTENGHKALLDQLLKIEQRLQISSMPIYDSKIGERQNRPLKYLAAWANSLHPIAEMPLNEKLLILQRISCPFTLLHFVQNSMHKSGSGDGFMMWPIENNCLFDYSEESRILLQRIKEEIVHPIHQLDLKMDEFAWLKAILLLQPDIHGLSSSSRNILLQSRDAFLRAMLLSCPNILDGSIRLAKLLLLIPTFFELGQAIAKFPNLGEFFGFNSPNHAENPSNPMVDEVQICSSPIILPSSISTTSSIEGEKADEIEEEIGEEFERKMANSINIENDGRENVDNLVTIEKGKNVTKKLEAKIGNEFAENGKDRKSENEVVASTMAFSNSLMAPIFSNSPPSLFAQFAGNAPFSIDEFGNQSNLQGAQQSAHLAMSSFSLYNNLLAVAANAAAVSMQR